MSTNAQHFLNFISRQQSLAVAVERHFDLVVCELLVQLGHFPPDRRIDVEEP